MARVALLFTLTICIVIVLSGVEGKKNGKSKQAKAKKIQGLFLYQMLLVPKLDWLFLS